MTDIKESDIIKQRTGNDEYMVCLGGCYCDEKKADAIIQQILQNRKDAQEYRELKTQRDSYLDESDTYKDFPPITQGNIETWNGIVYSWILHGMMKDDRIKYGSAMGRAEVLTNKLFDALKLQSQHKKLVDAIQNKIDDKLQLPIVTYTLQNLLKESEKE